MKRLYSTIIIAFFAAAFIAGCSKGYEAQKTADGMTVALSASSYPLVKGDNTLTVKVTDGAGKAVTDAQVTARFYMPPMPGMAPMALDPSLTLKGGAYTFTVNPPMEGGWKTDVVVSRNGSPAATTATFNLDVR